MSIVVLPHPILCPVVREWLAGADCMWEKLVGLWYKSSIEWVSCSIVLLIVVVQLLNDIS